METYKNFINGEWVDSNSTQTTPNLNPADTKDVIGTVALGTIEDVRWAIASAEAALLEWKSVPAPHRGRFIDKARQGLERRKEEVAKTLSREEGKPLHEALDEVQKSISILEWMAGEAARISGETFPSEMKNTFTYTIRQPIGVVAAVTPWNIPVAIPCWKIAPALAAGCTVVFKPSTLTPETAKQIVEIFEESGLPKGVLNLVYATGSVAGKVILDHPAVRAISFTGSNEVGMKLNHDGAAKGKKIQCEMGGKNPVIVLEDADLDLAADGIVQGAFGSTGQRCTATSRVVVMDAVADSLVEKIKERLSKLEMGPIIDENQMTTVLEAIETAKKEGAKLVHGGSRIVDGGRDAGFFVEPTIFDDVHPRSKLAQEEVFGPVLAIQRVGHFEQAMVVANDVKYGLTASIYTNDPSRMFRFIEEIETGMTHVNSPTVGGEPQLPFGGTKQTGLGTREMGRTAIDFFTELKAVYLDFTGKQRQSNIY